MWSNQYWYYNIRSDANYSQSIPTKEIVDFLKNIPTLKKNGAQTFTNQSNFPWLNIACVYSNNGNFDASHKTERVNLISIVASKHNPEDELKYIELLKTVADKLKWELILEEDDGGNKDVILN